MISPPADITCRFGCPATRVAGVMAKGTEIIFGYLWYCDLHPFPPSDLTQLAVVWKDTSDDGS